MKPVLIISYYFPPGNFAGSYRMKAWAEHLHKFGYYPIVVTRHWKENETDYTAIADKDELSKEEYGHYTVYRLPYKGSIRDRLVKRFEGKMKSFAKLFSFFQVLGQNYFLFSAPYHNLYFFSRNLLKERPDIRILITSGRPFLLFRFAYLLKREFPNISWLADYRDPWNSCPLIKQSFKQRLFRLLEKPMEKKWVAKADSITTVSEGISSSISKIVDRSRAVIVTNGFEEFVETAAGNHAKSFSIAYIGSLYDSQQIEVFLEGFKRYIKKTKHSPAIDLQFLGLGNSAKQNSRIKRALSGFEEYYYIENWLPKEVMMNKASMAHNLLLCGMPDRKGTYTAKFFDYLSLQRNIVLCPSDGDILEKTINETHSGIVLNTSEEVSNYLDITYRQWEEQKSIPYYGQKDKILSYSYKKQVQILSHVLDSIRKP
jgi:hypothetical protein